MGNANKQRRGNNRRGASGERVSPIALLRGAVGSWGRDPRRDRRVLELLAAHGPEAGDAVDDLLAESLGAAWRRGWTPADVVRVVGRRLSGDHAGLAARAVVADGWARSRSGEAMHPRWEAQLQELTGRAERSAPPAESFALAIDLLQALAVLPDITRTVPPPGAAVTGATGRDVALDERMLARVRALLAKAESTQFAEEGEALTAKAQELIARHAIDEALVASADDVGEPLVRRIPVDEPYGDAKASLLARIAAANRCTLVYDSAYGWVTAFGYEHDLNALELLAASLLTQATSAMVRQGPRRDASGRSTTRSFRRAFLFGFGQRIGQRLQEATTDQVSAADNSHAGRLLPVLAARDERVQAAQEAAFPRVSRRSTSLSSGTGWLAGQAAADLAKLDVAKGTLGGH